MEDRNIAFETSHFSTYGLGATPRADGQGPLQNNASVGGEPTGGGSGLAQTGDANVRILFRCPPSPWQVVELQVRHGSAA